MSRILDLYLSDNKRAGHLIENEGSGNVYREMNLVPDDDRRPPPPPAMPEPTLRCVLDCGWLSDAPHSVKGRFEQELRKVEQYRPGFLDFLQAHDYLDRYCAANRAQVERWGGWQSQLTSDFPFRAAVEAANDVTIALSISNIVDQEFNSRAPVRSAMVLGCGYWSYARALGCELNATAEFVGVDIDSRKITGFEQSSRIQHALETDRFRIVRQDFRSLPLDRSLLGQNRTFDLVVLHNPELPDAEFRDFKALCKGVLANLAYLGRFVVIMDRDREARDGNGEFFRLLERHNVTAAVYLDNRVPSGTGRSVIEKRPIKAIALTRDQVATLA